MNIAIRAAVEKDAAALNRLNTVFNGVGNITEEDNWQGDNRL